MEGGLDFEEDPLPAEGLHWQKLAWGYAARGKVGSSRRPLTILRLSRRAIRSTKSLLSRMLAIQKGGW